MKNKSCNNCQNRNKETMRGICAITCRGQFSNYKHWEDDLIVYNGKDLYTANKKAKPLTKKMFGKMYNKFLQYIKEK